MKLDKLKQYKINENAVFNESDRKHVENYRQLIKFFENAIHSSIKDGAVNYSALHASCLQSIRFLDNLILTYDNSIQSARLVNNTIDKIISDNKSEEKEGNEEIYQTPL